MTRQTPIQNAMTARKAQTLLVAVLAVLFVQPTWAQVDQPDTPDTMVFDQQRALAHLKELEQRMFRLAEAIRVGQPEDASRLILAVERSRQSMLAQRMERIKTLLADADLELALNEQQQVLSELEAIRKLLLSADVEVDVKLEQLRQLNQAIERLRRLEKQEQRQQQATNELGEQAEKSKFESLSAGESQQQQRAKRLEDQVRSISRDSRSAAGKISQAGKSMKSASEKLSQSKPKDASKLQQQARDQLNQAGQMLEQQREQLQQELEDLIRQRLLESLEDMLERQRLIRETTEGVLTKLDTLKDTALQNTGRRISDMQQEVLDACDATATFVDETSYSAVLPMVLADLQKQMTRCRDDLLMAAFDQPLVDRLKQIEHGIEQLIEAFEDSNETRQQNQQQQNQSQQQQQQRNKMAKLVEELRMLKIMEVSLRDQTVSLDQQRQAQSLEDTAAVTRARNLAKRQAQVREVTRELDKRLKSMQ